MAHRGSDRANLPPPSGSKSNLYATPAKAQAYKVFTYYTGSGYSTLGEDAAASYDCAIFVPAEYAGMQIEKVGLLLSSPDILLSPKAWVSSSLPVTADAADIATADITESVSSDEGYTYITFDNPCTIPDGGCYVGYSFTIDDASEADGRFPVKTAPNSEPAVDGGHWLRASLTVQEWTNMYGTGFGNLATQVFITGNFPENGATVAPTLNDGGWAVKGEGGLVSITVTGTGTTPVSSIDYTVTNTATGQSYEMHADLGDDAVAFDETKTIKVPVKEFDEAEMTQITLTVDKVNGNVNETKGNSTAAGQLLTLASRVRKMIVEEEFTSTDCGFCPRGITGMRLLKELYPESFIGIAVHDNMNRKDPMKVTVYNSVLNNYKNGLPSATLNRTWTIDPYYGSDITGSTPFSIESDYKALLESPAELGVSLTTSWDDADYTKIKLSTDITPQYSGNSAPWSIGYVILEDSLTGNDNTWYQSNYYSGQTSLLSDPYMKEWVLKPSIVKDMVYDHVAIAAAGINTGLKNIVKAPFTEGVAHTHEYTIDLSGNKVLQDKKHLKAVAIIFNTKTGIVVNATETAIGYDGPTGIYGPAAEAGKTTETARYTIDGRRTDGTAKGLGIIRMSDGSVRKVFTK